MRVFFKDTEGAIIFVFVKDFAFVKSFLVEGIVYFARWAMVGYKNSNDTEND